jgi:hypothetical protein
VTVLAWAITFIVALILVTFAVALVGINRLPLGERPKTPIYDRFGRPEGEAANPDYHENPGESPVEDLPSHLHMPRKSGARAGGADHESG